MNWLKSRKLFLCFYFWILFMHLYFVFLTDTRLIQFYGILQPSIFITFLRFFISFKSSSLLLLGPYRPPFTSCYLHYLLCSNLHDSTFAFFSDLVFYFIPCFPSMLLFLLFLLQSFPPPFHLIYFFWQSLYLPVLSNLPSRLVSKIHPHLF